MAASQKTRITDMHHEDEMRDDSGDSSSRIQSNSSPVAHRRHVDEDSVGFDSEKSLPADTRDSSGSTGEEDALYALKC